MLSLMTFMWACSSKPKAPAQKAPTKAASTLPENVLKKTLNLPKYGNLVAWHPLPVSDSKGMVIVLSDTPSPLVAEIAKKAVVLEIPTRTLRKHGESVQNRCWYPADELELLAQSTERILAFDSYIRPILYADGSAAALAWLTVAQAPADTFAGLLATNLKLQIDFINPFCGKGEWSAKPKDGIINLLPLPSLLPRPDGGPRVLLSPTSRVDLTAFLGAMPAAALQDASKVMDTLNTWLSPTPLPASAAAEGPEGLRNLGMPLVVSWPETPHQVLVMASEDGGWSDVDRAIAANLKKQNIAVVGLDSLRYFWETRTPKLFAEDLGKLLNALPSDVPLWLGGYGHGAEVVPLTLPLIDPMIGHRVSGLILLAPGPLAAFEITPLELIRTSHYPTDNPVAPAILTTPLPVLCLYPLEDEETACPLAPSPSMRVSSLPGGAGFAGDDATLSREIQFFMDTPPPPPMVVP